MSGTRGDARPPAAAASVEEDPNAAVVCSSPPCFMHELDPAYLGYLGREEVAALLAGLLAADWGGVVPDQRRVRASLRRRLEATGGPAAGTRPLGRGPDRIAQTLREALARIHDDALRRDLEEVLGALGRSGSPNRGDTAPGER